MYFLVNTLSVVAMELTLTVTLLGAPVTAERAVVVAPRIVPIDCVVPPGLTLIELGSSTMDTREMADVSGPVPTWPTSVAESQAVAVASNTIATLAIVIRGALIRLQALGTVTVPDLPSRSTLRRRPGAVNNRPR
jgi:hypothetical protein